MKPTKTTRALLVTSGLIAAAIGASILFVPEAFHASNGIELASDASSMSEVRAPGGALLLFGVLMIVGVFQRAFTFASLTIAAAVYLSYGLARLVSVAFDGMPAPGLVGAIAIELGLGAACAVVLLRATRRADRVLRAAGEAA